MPSLRAQQQLPSLVAQAAVLDTAAEGVALFDANGRYAFVNERLARMLGRKREELIGREALDGVDEAGRELVRAALTRREATSDHELDVPLVRADGSRVWVLLAISPTYDEAGHYAGALGIVTDITERHRGEVGLRVLVDVTAVLSESPEYEVTLPNVARALVPRLADACTIQLEERGALHLLARSGEENARGSRLTVPMRTREASIGLLTLTSTTRRYDERDRELVQEIASRVACSIEHARLHRDVENQRSRLRVVSDVSRMLGAQLDFDAIARVVARAVQGGVVVHLLQPDGVLKLCATASVRERVQKRLALLIGSSLHMSDATVAEEAFRTRAPVFLSQPEAVARLHPPFDELARELGVSGVVVAPLTVHGRAVGAISMFRGHSGAPFVPDDVSLIQDIADRAAMAFERAQLSDQQQQANERLRLLADAGTLLAQSLQVEPTLATLARLAVQWFAQAAVVQLFDDHGRISAEAIAGSDARLEEGARRAMFGYRRTLVPTAAPLVRSSLEDRRPYLFREVDEEVLRGLSVDDAQRDLLRAVGMRSLVIAPLVARGSTLGVVAMARTDGHLYDEEDLALAIELATRAALAVDNARLFRQAQDAVAVRDQFLSIAGHELNTPLTPLKMQLDSLRRGKFSPERTTEKLDATSRQVTRLAKLVSELLDVSRISSGRMQLEPERFDLAALVDEVVARLSDEAERAGSKITALLERPCFGSWDRLRVDQVVSNVVTNAIKYGGGRPIDVALTAPGDGARVRLIVRDRGIGILPEHQLRIFERFERAVSVRHYGGFGLGLWICRQIVEASGGTIAVQSAPGEGSTFAIELPREPPKG